MGMFNRKLRKRVEDLEERTNKGLAFFDDCLNKAVERIDAKLADHEQRLTLETEGRRGLEERIRKIEVCLIENKVVPRLAELDARIADHEARIDGFLTRTEAALLLKRFNEDESRLEVIETRVAAIEHWKNAPNEAGTGQEEQSGKFAQLNSAVANLTGMVTALQSKLHEPGLFSKVAELDAKFAQHLTAWDSIRRNILHDLCEQGKMVEDQGLTLRNVIGNAAHVARDVAQIERQLRNDITELIEATRCRRVEHPAVAAVPAYSKIDRIPK